MVGRRNAPRRASSAPLPQERLTGECTVVDKSNNAVNVCVEGWTIDWTHTRSATAEKYLFSPDGTGAGLNDFPGFTHIERQRKRGTMQTTWKLVNRQPRTTVRRDVQRVRKAPTPSATTTAVVAKRPSRKRPSRKCGGIAAQPPSSMTGTANDL
jgi:hypothetical protein